MTRSKKNLNACARHAMMAETRKGMDHCITILDRMIAAQHA
jgi:hypothetical protein